MSIHCTILSSLLHTDVFHNKRGWGVTASRELKGKERWLGGQGRREARGRRGAVSTNTATSQGQNCVRPG